MSSVSRSFTLAMLALALVLSGVAVEQAEASCGSSKRVSHRDAACLYAEWDNSGTWPAQRADYEVQNLCPEFGRVVAKVDVKNSGDKTLNLDDGSSRGGTIIGSHVRWIYCCKDLSFLCSRNDVLNPEGCNDQFDDSPADDSCSIDESATTYSAGSGDGTCTFSATCDVTVTADDGTTSTEERDVSTTVSWHLADDLQHCGDGTLQTDACDS